MQTGALKGSISNIKHIIYIYIYLNVKLVYRMLKHGFKKAI